MEDPFDNLPIVTLPEPRIEPGDLLTKLRGSTIFGSDPRRLAHYVADAMNGLDLIGDDSALDIMPAWQRAAYEAARDRILDHLRSLLAIGSSVAPETLGVDGVSTDAHPWAGDVDHVFAAAVIVVGPSGGRSRDQAATDLATAARLLAGLMPLPVEKKRSGVPAAMGGAYRIVRAVCVYRHELGLPIDCVWTSRRDMFAAKRSPRLDHEMIPKSETAELIHNVAKALALNISNASLEVAHKAFLKEVVKRGRDPDQGDLIVK